MNATTFTGRLLDTEYGQYYFRNRYYGSGLGRFAARDPIGYVDGLNLYAGYFVPGGVDPLGLQESPQFDLSPPGTFLGPSSYGWGSLEDDVQYGLDVPFDWALAGQTPWEFYFPPQLGGSPLDELFGVIGPSDEELAALLTANPTMSNYPALIARIKRAAERLERLRTFRLGSARVTLEADHSLDDLRNLLEGGIPQVGLTIELGVPQPPVPPVGGHDPFDTGPAYDPGLPSILRRGENLLNELVPLGDPKR